MNIEIITGDLTNPAHAQALTRLLSEYATDPMGGSKALPDEVLQALPQRLSARADYLFVLAKDESGFVGLTNCFEGFSTFKAQPLLNIHDVVVSTHARGRGVARLMLQRVETIARERGCCKLTLEVLEGNRVAQNSYRAVGFNGYELDPAMGRAMFWEKPLT
ncbi:GNAT family N-acetyltransferase [Halopseudomonas maritima]|uniref:GNAT family N-acetyltransferase n=1 Tax=Halopseudomonas maritima TaxID=2918528 RepID=UPI001EEAE3A5|nr:GNAT family N-acetyltransferase [Halopseudomonas maritima]UJJ31514.1 GNAT family N-acetyltransferase [Halopseudomonas maritima]